MSSMPARVSEQSQGLALGPLAGGPATVRAPGRAERRTERQLVRRTRRRWALFGLVMMTGCFALTVGILDVLR